MNVKDTLERLLDEGIIVAVRLGEGAPVVEVCRALARGGLKVLEITLTTPGALEAIREMSGDGSLLVGGGTVLTPEDVRNVAGAGGRFALSPVFTPEVLDEAEKLGLLAIPGAGTPSEIQKAHLHGARLVKFFPSGALGGPAFMKAFHGPFPDIPLVPTSGPTAATLAGYIEAGAVAVGVGGPEFFAPGFTPESVEEAARNVRAALTAAERSTPRRRPR